MNTMTDYKLANFRRKELVLSQTRKEILNQDGQTALESILDAPAPASLIQSFPDQDLYYLMHKVGPADFAPVLSMATSEQWEYILDLEAWDNDRVDLATTTKTLDVLFQADPQRLMRWLVKEKPEFVEYYFFRNMEVRVREHDDPPPEDHPDYITWDDKFYFRFLKTPKGFDEEGSPLPPAGDLFPELIEKMLKTTAHMDLSVFHSLLLETGSILPAEAEEEQFRLKNIRLAEKGFLPVHEAAGVYQPITCDQLRQRPQRPVMTPDNFDPTIPLPPQYHRQYIQSDTLFENALARVNPELLFDLNAELGALINKVVSADKVKIREKEDLENMIRKTMIFLSLGLESIIGPNGQAMPDQGAAAIETYFLEDIFRTGSAQSIGLKSHTLTWYNQSFILKKRLPLSFLGEHWLGVIGGLFLERPLFFDNYATTQTLYRPFQTLGDIDRTKGVTDQVMALDAALEQLNPEFGTFDEGILTFKTLLLTLWAKDRLHLEPTLEAVDQARFKPFFKEMFDQDNPGIRDIRVNDFLLWISEQTGTPVEMIEQPLKAMVSDLFQELEEEYGNVPADHVDPRFIQHFLLK
ncbi:MAG: hypothetical protein D3926_00940 [Desulfobacteraceae bacterium]|nr:MAG: hypothetical protein D3926_00940 [Desulfobacteraceae bacterium]